MRLGYTVAFTLRAVEEPFTYAPTGVWVEGPGEGIDLVIRFLPGYDAEQAEADRIIARMVAAGMRALPDG